MKKIAFVIILVIFLVSIVRLVVSIYTLWHKQDVLTTTQHQLQQEKRENTLLHQQLTMVNAPSFLEEEARNKLFLVKPGEGEIMISKDVLSDGKMQKSSKDRLPTWQQWLNLFFY